MSGSDHLSIFGRCCDPCLGIVFKHFAGHCQPFSGILGGIVGNYRKTFVAIAVTSCGAVLNILDHGSEVLGALGLLDIVANCHEPCLGILRHCCEPFPVLVFF